METTPMDGIITDAGDRVFDWYEGTDPVHRAIAKDARRSQVINWAFASMSSDYTSSSVSSSTPRRETYVGEIRRRCDLYAENPSRFLVSREQDFTSLNMRNFPRYFQYDHMLNLLYKFDFLDSVDFINIAFRKNNLSKNLGFAIINFTSHIDAAHFKLMLEGYNDWEQGPVDTRYDGNCRLEWNRSTQGLENLINYYRDAPIVLDNMKADITPMMLLRGEKMGFPISRRAALCAEVKVKSQKKTKKMKKNPPRGMQPLRAI